MRASTFMFASDLCDEGFDVVLGRVADAGLDGVTLACAYHHARDVFPHNPAGRVRFLDGGAVFFRPDPARFRDLRKSDDDFGFSRKEEKPSPGKQLGTILKDGPGVGVHVVIWCDSLNNLNRSFDRQTIREFEMRVLFQMSPNDSSTLIDSPLAARLGPRRAFFSSEEQGTLEKFRPYGLPGEEWWTWVRDLLVKRRASDIVIS